MVGIDFKNARVRRTKDGTRHALINEKGLVVNVVMWQPESRWQIPEGHRLIEARYVQIGDWWDEANKKFERVHDIQK